MADSYEELAARVTLIFPQAAAETSRQHMVRWAIRLPMVSRRAWQDRERGWEARYPAADWSVTGDSRDSAMARLREAVLDRRGAEDEGGWQLAAVRRHLEDGPVPGVYAIHERIMSSADPKAALDEFIRRQL